MNEYAKEVEWNGREEKLKELVFVYLSNIFINSYKIKYKLRNFYL